MKKYLLLAVLGYLSVYNPVHAQLEKGTGYLGATIGLSGSDLSQSNPSGTDYSENRFDISPSLSAGKFVKDNFLLGINAGAGITAYTRIQNDQKNTRNHFRYFASPFIRNYKTIGDKAKWAVFLTSSAEFALTNYKTKSEFGSNTESGFSAGLKVLPGIAYWITPRFSLESDINLLSLEAGYSSFEESKSFYFRSGATTSLNGYFSVRAAWYIQKR
jgi:hypothetical protein